MMEGFEYLVRYCGKIEKWWNSLDNRMLFIIIAAIFIFIVFIIFMRLRNKFKKMKTIEDICHKNTLESTLPPPQSDSNISKGLITTENFKNQMTTKPYHSKSSGKTDNTNLDTQSNLDDEQVNYTEKSNEDSVVVESIEETSLVENVDEEKPFVVEFDIEKERQAAKQVATKVYFPLNNGSYILSISMEKNFHAIYEAVEQAEGEYSFSILSLDKVKTRDVSDAIVPVGTVLKKDATGFKTASRGTIIERTEGGNKYWEITKKAEIEYIG